MAMHTSYRYEVLKPSKHLTAGLRRQQERIKNDDLTVKLHGEVNDIAKNTFKANWAEKLDEGAAVKKTKASLAAVKKECVIMKKASIMIRQEALRQLLEFEYREYEKEFHAKGLAIYWKRT